MISVKLATKLMCKKSDVDPEAKAPLLEAPQEKPSLPAKILGLCGAAWSFICTSFSAGCGRFGVRGLLALMVFGAVYAITLGEAPPLVTCSSASKDVPRRASRHDSRYPNALDAAEWDRLVGDVVAHTRANQWLDSLVAKAEPGTKELKQLKERITAEISASETFCAGR